MVLRVSKPSYKQTLDPPGNEAPVWSPNGTRIAFMDCTSPTHICQIALMTATGANRHDITSDQTLSNQKPDWQAREHDGDRHEG